MVTLRLFAQIREAAGTGRATFDTTDVATVDQLVAAAIARFGDGFAALVPTCRCWVNGQPAAGADRLSDGDEVALLPPVSGG